MCGITFYCSSRHQASLQSNLNDSLISTRHRGPDFSDRYFTSVKAKNIGLGHNRLSVIDLSPDANQPMFLDGLVIVFNGEIYNFKKLRAELISEGVEFTTSSDTEVILRLYQKYGDEAFKLLRGMFAFCLLDQSTSKLFVVRDVIGIKPIYLYQDDKGIVGCSEIKGLRNFDFIDFEVDKNDVFEFFNVGFLYEPNTGYQKIKKLPPGHYLELDLDDKNLSSKMIRYAEIADFDSGQTLEQRLSIALKNQNVADVKVGTFFSGGIDSSIMAALIKKNDLFFAKYENDYWSDIDLEYSRKIATFLNKDLSVVNLSSEDQSSDDLLKSIEFVAKYSEELVSDYTFWSAYQLSMKAKNSGYTVMLSGMGADEIYAGYPRYTVLNNHKLVKLATPILKILNRFRLFPNSLSKKFERLISYCDESNWQISYARLLGYFNTIELSAFFKNYSDLEKGFIRSMSEKIGSANNNKVKWAQKLDSLGYLPRNLMVSDKASMLASLELRVPLLDESVVAFGMKLPKNRLIVNRKLKYPLKEVLQKHIPAKFLDRKKTGFNPPLDNLITKIGKKRLAFEYQLLGAYINTDAIDKILDDHFEGKKNNTYKLWQLLFFSKWLQANF